MTSIRTILIADGGATKIDWRLCSTARCGSLAFTTQGINAAQSPPEAWLAVLHEARDRVAQMGGNVCHIYYYGAGCTLAIAPRVAQAIAVCFPQSKIAVHSDLLGAARALCDTRPGIACILGTGSASCQYDGTHIIRQTPSLGYVLGDEGSGAVLGRQLIADYLKGQLPSELAKDMAQSYPIDVTSVINHVYAQPRAGAYLAQFVPFLHQHMEHEYVQQVLHTAFCSFLKRNVLAYDTGRVGLSFVGSVAYHFSTALENAVLHMGLHIETILQHPITGLVHYHQAADDGESAIGSTLA